MDEMTPSQQAAAFHGLATNEAMPVHERLSFALTALDMYEAEVDRLRAELRDAGNDLLDVRGVLSPNGYPCKVPLDLVPTVAPAVQWLVDELERLRGDAEQAAHDGYRACAEQVLAALARPLAATGDRPMEER